MQPLNPIVGGTALRIPAVNSPDFVTGVSGWIIRKDGSAEFNNLTLRGTFYGTDYILNAAGAFFYNGVPAAGNLIASIAAVAGTDSFGNGYIPGVVTYRLLVPFGQVSFIQLIDDNMLIGGVSSGVFDIAGAAVFGTNNGHDAIIQSGLNIDVSETVQGSLHLFAGIPAAVTGGAKVPHVDVVDDQGSSPVDLRTSGSLVQTDVNGTPLTWQVPTLGANYNLTGTNGLTTVRFRKSGNNRVRFYGAFNVATAGTQALFTVGAGYIPALQGYISGGTANAATFLPMSFKVSNAGVVTPTASLATGIWYINGEIELGDLP